MTDNLNMFNKVKHFVDEKFAAINGANEIKHLLRTVYWLEKLRPEPDKALIIAAYSHDIERAVRYAESQREGKEFTPASGDQELLTLHQVRGGQIMKTFLMESGATADLANKVEWLISKHEVGGDEDQNILKDADSISFLEVIAPSFIDRWLPTKGKEFVTKKIQWMFDRISSPAAKDLAKPFYIQAAQLLNL